MKSAGSYERLLRLVALAMLVVCTLSWCGCSSDKLIVLTESEMVYFVKPGESWHNDTEQELCVISKGSYILLSEAAANSIGGD